MTGLLQKERATEIGTVVSTNNLDLENKTVMYKDYNLMELEVEGEKHYFLEEHELLAVIE